MRGAPGPSPLGTGDSSVLPSSSLGLSVPCSLGPLVPASRRLTLPDPEPIIASSSRRCPGAHSFREMPRAMDPLQERPKGIVKRIAMLMASAHGSSKEPLIRMKRLSVFALFVVLASSIMAAAKPRLLQSLPRLPRKSPPPPFRFLSRRLRSSLFRPPSPRPTSSSATLPPCRRSMIPGGCRSRP